MSLTLLEASKLVQDPLKRGVIEIFPRVSPVLERLPFFEVRGQIACHYDDCVLEDHCSAQPVGQAAIV